MAVSKIATSDFRSKLIAQYGCGPIKFMGGEEALYERHLLFDNIVDPGHVSLRERFEAVARSFRSGGYVLSKPTTARIPNVSTIFLSSFCLAARSPITSRTFCSIQSRTN